ncbi:5-formyltetrahydrofolate cyclo-ligase [Pseudonocardia xinjiangensis]|uniref:5-formyltetrahydrofolate cyclo-ligase n=1 Tax=Pseudonocardia xinjiangensis TaxID=75289 RepID=A0ABX1RDL9_9PSEU|nr:5-formyltetrahydrofolate cyclo-ligase [Pseudonocardia xinjiangensis]NMH77979.1 5-formyltetrahydrofolate cyclo-ligase [Pseudonocardia xinjiangensis]
MTARANRTERAVVAEKNRWRTRIVAARRALPAEVRAARAVALAEAAVGLAAITGGPVCAYLPVGLEPGSPELVAALHEAGHEVLLPVVPAAAGPLDWARYDGAESIAAGPLGLREPIGPRRGVVAIAAARLVLVPALAADRSGRRLGRGGGYYDRTLPLATAGVPLVVVLNDEELVAELPAEPHDRLVTAALLADAGHTPLGGAPLGNRE